MRQLTDKQKKGVKFEIWLEQVFKTVPGIYQVQRNIEYHKERYVFRQADLTYNIITPQGLELVIVEAKYSSNGPIQYMLREPKQKVHQYTPHINNLVEEIKEREAFIGAHKSILVTNKTFTVDLTRNALLNNIYLINKKGLEHLLSKQQKQNQNIELQIEQIPITAQANTKNIIYIP